MILFTLFFLLSGLTFGWDDQFHHEHCLTDDTAMSLVNKYYNMWAARDPAVVTQIVNDLMTDNFTREDETINFGLGPCVIAPEGPYAPNKQIFVATLMARLGEINFSDETYETEWMVHDCTSIAFRFRMSAVALGTNANLTALPGDSIHFRGTDIVEVDVEQMKLTKAVSSADWFWYEYYVGAKIEYQKYHFPPCSCPDPVPGFDAWECVAK